MRTLSKPISLWLPKSFVTAFLAAFYILAFLCTPYWAFASSGAGKLAILAITICAGGVWCVISAAKLCFQFTGKDLLLFAFLVVSLLGLNARALMSGLAWHGDESFHITQVFLLYRKIHWMWFAGYLAAFAGFLFLAWRRPRWAIPAGIGIVITTILAISLKNPFNGADQLLRYPYVSYWFAALAPKIVQTFRISTWYEVLYRVVPFLSACVLAWTFQKKLAPQGSAVLGYLWGLAVAVLPIVFYYASILYLELPAVCLMLVVCFEIKDLLQNDFAGVRQKPGWYALILIGFIKETAVPFLISFLVSRWIAQLIHRRGWKQTGQAAKAFPRWLVEEAQIAFAVLFPLFFYIFLRSSLTAVRHFAPDFSGLLRIETYTAYGQSFVAQFGLFLLFFLIGLGLFIKRREFAAAGFLILAFVATLLFHISDNWLFSGYSRFNLFILPLFLYGASPLLKVLNDWKKAIGAAAACVAIVISLLITPIHLDGSKRPLWDSYNIDTSEHYYPDRDAIIWLKRAYPETRILFAGVTADFNFGFYFQKYKWNPPAAFLKQDKAGDPAALITAAFQEAQARRCPVVLMDVPGDLAPTQIDGEPFVLEKVFQNQAHKLFLYKRKD